MNHPEISLMNAQLYLAKKMQEAESYRQAKKVLGNHRTFWGVLRHNFQLLKNPQKQTHPDESTLMESMS